MALSDRIAIFNAGRIEQLGTPRELYERPRTGFVAKFLGESNFFEGDVRRHDGEARLECSDGVGLGLPVAAIDGRGKVAVTLRPEHVNVSPDPGPGSGLEGVVRETYYLGAEQRLEVEVAPGRRIVAVRPAAARPPIDEGQTVRLGWDPEDVVVLAEAA